jgi:quinoprotein glucose dehydrogenase
MKRALFVVALLCLSPVLNAQSGAKNGEWRSYAGDTGSTRYSPLDQINAANFNKLEVAWRFKTDSLGPRPEYQYEGTPLMIGGVLYATGGSRRAVFALDAGTGELLWTHSEQEGARGSAAHGSCRVAASPTGLTDARNEFSTSHPVTGSSR